jgi:hypothetical protein
VPFPDIMDLDLPKGDPPLWLGVSSGMLPEIFLTIDYCMHASDLIVAISPIHDIVAHVYIIPS